MSTVYGYGIDVSHHQPSNKLPWNTWKGQIDFVIARANYGSDLRDKDCKAHIANARRIGAKVGLYAFYRPTQPWQAQLSAFLSVAAEVGLGPGDIVPVLDIEKDPFPKPGHEVASSWQPFCEKYVQGLIHAFGDAMIYITQREWRQMGSPHWVLSRPLWVAHYTSKSVPASPGDLEPTIWQHRVAPFVHHGPGGYDSKRPELDQNRLLKTLPLIQPPPAPVYDDVHFDDLTDKGILQCFDYTSL